MNALAHHDYGLDGATTDVTVWDDRIEVRSPGPLPGHITIGNRPIDGVGLPRATAQKLPPRAAWPPSMVTTIPLR